MGLGVSLEQHSQIFLMHPPIQTNTLCEDIFLKVEILFEDSFTQSTSVKRLKYCDFVCFIANITLRRGGIWNLAQTQRKKISVSFQILPWCLKAIFQIPPLRSAMFAVNTTTQAASNLDYLQFCSSQPLLSPGTVHQKFEWVFKILSEF